MRRHVLVRGINHYVPHAFSPKEFPDPDCPPHFYAHGHNPQYRHFGKLMAYTNRVCELISDGVHVAPAAILYHGDAEWSGECMMSHKVAHVLCDHQIDYDFVPQDVFAEPEKWELSISEGTWKVHTQEYRVLLVPYMQFVRKDFAKAVAEMCGKGTVSLKGLCGTKTCSGDQMSVYCCNAWENHLEKTDWNGDSVSLVIEPRKSQILVLDAEGDSLSEEYYREEPSTEGVEVFVNDQSLGIQIAAPYRYDLTKFVHEGENRINIQVATTLEREMSQVPNTFGEKPVPKRGSESTASLSGNTMEN